MVKKNKRSKKTNTNISNTKLNKQLKPRTRNRAKRAKAKTLCNLSSIACAYADALARPDLGPLVGIPNGDTIYSKKYRVWNRGTATGGTGSSQSTDLAFLVQPFASSFSDLNCLSIVAGGTTLPSDLNTGGAATNAPYATSSLGTASNKIQSRLVAAMLRVRFLGTMLNTGGVYYGLQEPTHCGIYGQTPANLMARTNCLHQAVADGGWFEVRYRPVDAHDASWIDGGTITNAYTYTLTSDGVTVATQATPFMGIYCSLPAASQPVEYEYWAIVEYAGANVTGKTITPPDVQGWASVIAANTQVDEVFAAERPGVLSHGESAGATISATVRKYAADMLEAASPYVTNLASAAGTALGAAAIRRLTQPQAPRIEYL